MKVVWNQKKNWHLLAAGIALCSAWRGIYTEARVLVVENKF